MTENSKKDMLSCIQNFRLPRYHEIPAVGLYLEQVNKYLSEYLSALGVDCLTSSMISNYVKKQLIASPEKKLYGRDQIAYLFFIALAKNILSLDSLLGFIRLQQQTYSTEVAYNYFCDELENMLCFVFGLKEKPDDVGVDSTEEKKMLRATIIAVAHTVYLEKCFAAMGNGARKQ